MNFNLNFGNQNDYDINESLIDEMISLYGVEIKLLLTEKINKDNIVFGDFSHMKTNTDDVFSMFVLPEETEDFSTDGYSFSPFGMGSFDNTVLFISKQSLKIPTFLMIDNVIDFRKLMSQLIIFPNNKLMEITDVDPCVPGVNNLFTNGNEKSVYKLTCKPYTSKLVQEFDQTTIEKPNVGEYNLTNDEDEDDIESTDNYETLDNYFDELNDNKDDQDDEVSELSEFSDIDYITGQDFVLEALSKDGSVLGKVGDYILSDEIILTDYEGNITHKLLNLDGSTFNTSQHPEIYEILGTNVLETLTSPENSPYEFYKVIADFYKEVEVDVVEKVILVDKSEKNIWGDYE